MSQIRKLKYHEQKLLKKTNFLEWKKDDTVREAAILRRYHITRREDYQYYNRLVGKLQQFAKKLAELPPDDEFRIQTTEKLVKKLYDMGILLSEGSLAAVETIHASAFCKSICAVHLINRRRLGVMLIHMKMAHNLEEADNLIRHGHVRVGTDLVTDPAYLVTRNMEDYVTWVDTSKIKRHVMKYNEKLDDFDLLGE
ncbi:u3 small nucleolar ribonucleoprotein [Blastocystis sp. subtype 4]|uniref:u3 small nucleolar ribonucleoprotein n=1 Tax=Blastocystis sp. subtype 4 TaxID=944170 RepID=UPI000711CD16|nr:u3 small nucleolar ribonucleoprotein [Blastocystis sp. subtype 4]KNB42220.1 u3 small nucleolar ribonucleoprotein [Blastocystis sp. subtype 4]|eukprot:XP_014525663.1 u3 small nucleolar ribonucleoprotein [Blastocystis sp. subtype 4]